MVVVVVCGGEEGRREGRGKGFRVRPDLANLKPPPRWTPLLELDRPKFRAFFPLLTLMCVFFVQSSKFLC